VNSIVFVTILD